MTTVEEVCAAVAGGRRVLPVGAGTKPALAAPPDAVAIDMTGLAGIVEYDPRELTITVRAGTPVREVRDALAANGQHLPFDPPFVAAGATIGGMVATGASGPCAFGRGGMRDFIIGVRFVDGTGRLVAGGGRVVKNAAGFDLAKLMVGSMGRLGVLVDVSFKVFPAPRTTTTALLDFETLDDALAAMSDLARGPLDILALDAEPPARLAVRVHGSGERIARAVRGAGPAGALSEGAEDAAYWTGATELEWVAEDERIVRAAITAGRSAELLDRVGRAGASARLSLAANVAWIGWPASEPLEDLDDILGELGTTGMALTGPLHRELLGRRPGGAFADRIRGALDPHDRFLEA